MVNTEVCTEMRSWSIPRLLAVQEILFWLVSLLQGIHIPYTKANWAGSSNSLKIEVCYFPAGSPDTAKVIVYVDGMSSTASCSATPPASTAATMFSPTSAHVATPPSAAPTATTSAPIATPVASSPVAAPVATVQKCQDTHSITVQIA